MEGIAADEDWRTCFAALAPGLLLFARQWVQSRADAEDLVQDAFVRIWRRDGAVENKALFYSAVRSLALDLLRRDSRRARRETEAWRESELEIEPQFAADNSEQKLLAAAVDRLPNEQREVVVMKIWNELTFAEIAGVLGISQNTAASRYRYAIAALKKNLASHV